MAKDRPLSERYFEGLAFYDMLCYSLVSEVLKY